MKGDAYQFYDELYTILGDAGAFLYCETNPNTDPYTHVTCHINGRTYGKTIDGYGSSYIDDDIEYWLRKYHIIIDNDMLTRLRNLGITGDFIIGNPEDNVNEEWC